MSSTKNLILVIGATGAQGLAVINNLLAPSADGTPSPYSVRALTRDPSSSRAQSLVAKGVEWVKGSFDDLDAVRTAFQGVYGAWVNTDGFTAATSTMRHYVWSNLDYFIKKGNYSPLYNCDPSNGKGRVGEWLKAQPSIISDDNMSWSAVTTGPYMDMLYNHIFGPLNHHADGTAVFVTCVRTWHVPMIALEDIGFWARYTFDHRAETSAKDLEIASDIVGWDYLTETFTKVTGKPAIVINQNIDEWFDNLINVDKPLALEKSAGDGSTTFRQNFTGWWSTWRDDIVKRDMDWIRQINPNGYTLERWMREHKYTGEKDLELLKNNEDAKSVRPNFEKWIQY